MDTGVQKARLAELAPAQTPAAGNFHPHPKIKKSSKARKPNAAGAEPLDWVARRIAGLCQHRDPGWRCG